MSSLPSPLSVTVCFFLLLLFTLPLRPQVRVFNFPGNERAEREEYSITFPRHQVKVVKKSNLNDIQLWPTAKATVKSQVDIFSQGKEKESAFVAEATACISDALLPVDSVI